MVLLEIMAETIPPGIFCSMIMRYKVRSTWCKCRFRVVAHDSYTLLAISCWDVVPWVAFAIYQLLIVGSFVLFFALVPQRPFFFFPKPVVGLIIFNFLFVDSLPFCFNVRLFVDSWPGALFHIPSFSLVMFGFHCIVRIVGSGFCSENVLRIWRQMRTYYDSSTTPLGLGQRRNTTSFSKRPTATSSNGRYD